MNVLLFDFDGVIVDSFDFCYRIIHARDGIMKDEYRARFEGNINDAQKKKIIDPNAKPFDFFGPYTEALMDTQPNEGMVQIIRELAKTRTLIIISSTISDPIRRFLEKHQLASAFKEILGNDVEKSKVKKIHDVLERYHLHPSETIFVTDTLGDINEARACGVESIAVTWGYHPIETLKQGNPLKIVDRPSEISEIIRSLG